MSAPAATAFEAVYLTPSGGLYQEELAPHHPFDVVGWDAAERSLGVTSFDELAVVIDTFAPPQFGEAAACEDPAYAGSWSREAPA